jgi:hypothetical protein
VSPVTPLVSALQATSNCTLLMVFTTNLETNLRLS